MQIVAEKQRPCWKTRVISELRQGSKGALSAQDVLLEKITAPVTKSQWASGCDLAPVSFGLLCLEIQKTNSTLLGFCEMQIPCNNVASPYYNLTPAMYGHAASKYCVAVVLRVLSVNNM